jgi:hypothetical protein
MIVGRAEVILYSIVASHTCAFSAVCNFFMTETKLISILQNQLNALFF